jgi:hypothetical protein
MRIPPRVKLAVVAALAALGPATNARATPKNEVTLAAGLDSAYDGNVFNGRGPDFVNRISPHFGWRFIDRRLTIDTTYDLGYWTYALGKAENSLNHRATLALEGRPTRRLTVQLADELVRAEDPGFITRIGVVAPQIGIVDNVLDAVLGFAITRRVYGDFGYTFHHASFDSYTAAQKAEGLPTLFDGDQHDVLGYLSYRVLHLDDVRFTGRVQVFTAGPQDVSSARWATAVTYSPTAGWRHQFVRPLEWTAHVGPVFYQSLPAASNIPGAPGSGVTWRLGTRLRLYTPTWRASASFTRDLLGATGVGAAIWADYAYLQVGYHYLERLDAHVGVGYFRNGRAVDQPFAYDGVTCDALLDVRVVNNFRVGAYYTLRWQETGSGAVAPGAPVAQFPNVTRNIVGIRLLAIVGADARPPVREVHE